MGADAWTEIRAGDPATVASVSSALIVTDATYGKVYRPTAWTGAGANVLTKGLVPFATGRKYEVTATFLVDAVSDGSVSMNLVGAMLKADYTNATNGTSQGPATAGLTPGSTLRTITSIFDMASGFVGGSGAPSSDMAFVRFGLRLATAETALTLSIISLSIKDVTEREAAAASASAAASSASSASTSATNAGNSASAAQTSATTATTKATDASNSATAAAGSASSASTSSTNAGSSATAAQNSATSAATQAGNAASSASAASGSAASASGSASAAANQASLAANYSAAAQTVQDTSWPNYVGPIGGNSYDYAGDNATNFQFNYGPNNTWPQPWITAQPGGYGGTYNRITFKKARPKATGRRYRVTGWIYTNATNRSNVIMWLLGTNTNDWDGSAVSLTGSDSVTPAGCINWSVPAAGQFVKVGVEFTVPSDWTVNNWKPIFEFQTTGGAPNGIWHMTGITVEDVTSEYAAAASASASSSSAAVASASAAAASTSATVAATYGGGGGNLLRNSSLPNKDTSGWSTATNYGSGTPNYTYSVDGAGDAWRPPNEHVMAVYQVGGVSGSYGEWQGVVPAQAGKVYEASVYTGLHRCTGNIYLIARDSGGGWLTVLGQAMNASKAGGTALDGYDRPAIKLTAPAGTYDVMLMVRKENTNAGQADSWLFATRPQIKEVNANATVPTPYSPSDNRASVEVTAAAAADAYNRTRAYWQVNAAVPGSRAQLTVWADNGGAGVDIVGNVAISGNLITAGTINGVHLADLAVTTAKLAANAATVPSWAYTAASMGFAEDVWSDVQSLTIGTAGGTVQLLANLMATIFRAGGGVDNRFQVLRDGAVIFGPVTMPVVVIGSNSAYSGPAAFQILDTPSAGTHTYKIQCYRDTATFDVAHRTLVATELKR
ncbi:hypothetical protein VVT58_15560 [Sphingobium sp. SJ10-10]|uniref:hypothetical protein n=1 Tax=Sphingobium sp. SJ10-10 TaxID=3114999 RepID=UPI002E1801F1|nr:hypothetical protein [Sphingobium sp. SJ10-10]